MQQLVTVEGTNCGALLAALDKQLIKTSIGHSPVLFLKEMIYNRKDEERKSIECFHEKKGNYFYVDLQDGQLVDKDARRFICRRFLRPSSPLPSPPGLQPVIHIETEGEFLTTVPQRQLQAAPTGAVTDLSFKAMLRGVRCGKQMFWQVEGYRLMNSETGLIYHISDIRGGFKRFVFLLMREKDQVPRIRVPDNEVLLVFRRERTSLRVFDGSISCTEPPHSEDVDLWMIPEKNDTFSKYFTRAASK